MAPLLRELLGSDYSLSHELVALNPATGDKICLGASVDEAVKTIMLMKLVASFGRVERTSNGWEVTDFLGEFDIKLSNDFDEAVETITSVALKEGLWYDFNNGIKVMTNSTHGMVYRSGRINTYPL